MHRSVARTLAVFATCAMAWACAPEPPDGIVTERQRVVILVIDGLRPEYVTPELMPELDALAERGVRGLAHHAVFPTVTRVNGPSIFTGRYPGGHGMMGNSVYLPEVADRVLDAGSREDLLVIDAATGGSMLTAPSLGELLEAGGLGYFAASSGSTGSGTLMNHRGASAGLLHHDFALPDSLATVAERTLGGPPEIEPGSSSTPLVARALDALVSIGIDQADADVLAAWLTEPDGTAHANGIGAPETVRVLAEVDAEIARFLRALEERGVLEHTDVLVTSDHGFTTRTGAQSVGALLVAAGLKDSPTSTDVVVAGGAIHVQEGDADRVAEIVRELQETEWVGPVFTAAPGGGGELGSVEGTVAFSAIGWSHERSADVLMSATWTDATNEHGYRGEVLTPGVAGHGSSSPWDIRATFLAAGPSFKRGIRSSVPTGNIDITPTTLALVGLASPAEADGRVVEELMAGGADPGAVAVEPEPIEVSRELDGMTYRLTVHRTRVGETVYFDGTEVVREPSSSPGGGP